MAWALNDCKVNFIFCRRFEFCVARERTSETINRPMKKEGGRRRSKVRKALQKELKLVGGYVLLLLTDWGRLGTLGQEGCLTIKFCGCVGVSFTKYLCACIKQSQSITEDYYHGILCVFNRKRVEGERIVDIKRSNSGNNYLLLIFLDKLPPTWASV